MYSNRWEGLGGDLQADTVRHTSGEVNGSRIGVDVDYYNNSETALIRLGILLAGLVKSLKRLDRKILNNNFSAR